ncbi:MAG: ATP-binding cassette domain-containing protein [Armatimonadetes bacterium]|nr:ATP-binding cassette domain-containing protein [Armatimonadota bacterium]
MFILVIIFVAILGHNGSGKSTLAKHLNALLLPALGDVYIDSMNTKDSKLIWKIREKVGMVFQNPDNQLVATVVEDEVAFGPENLGLKPLEIKERVNQSLHAVGMQDYRNFAPHLLSGGQKQKIAIAGILALLPKYLVLDEPTTMLDFNSKEEIKKIIKKLNQAGTTIIYITHFMEEALLAQRVLVMREGKIVDDGTPEHIFTKEDFLLSLEDLLKELINLRKKLGKNLN